MPNNVDMDCHLARSSSVSQSAEQLESSAEPLKSQHEAHSNATRGTVGSKMWIEKHNFWMLPSSWCPSGTWAADSAKHGLTIRLI